MGETPRDIARLNEWLFVQLPAAMPEWLPAQRWYGGKAHSIARATTEDVCWLPSVDEPCAVVVVGVEYQEVATRRQPPARLVLLVACSAEPMGCPIIGRADWQPDLRIVEATTSAAAIRGLLQGLVSGGSLQGEKGGQIGYADASHAAARVLDSGEGDGPEVAPLRAEQSNSSLRIGATHILKVFRRLEEGENPEAEVGRFLATRTSFRAAPHLEGSITYRGVDGSQATLAVLENWIENTGDGWSHVLAALGRGESDTLAIEDLLVDAFVLGRTTAEFHAALASDPDSEAFAPEPVGAADLALWEAGAQARCDHVLGLVERKRESWGEEGRRLADLLLPAREELKGRLLPSPIDGTGESFCKIRIHGDYHLGQTLKVHDGFVLIDFEGEPGHSIAERRLKTCALKDVAGMLRSFEYAVETVKQQSGGTRGAPVLSKRLRSAFLDGYCSRAAGLGAVFVPSQQQALSAWVEFFELDRTLYEVEYEANSRPAWVHIPLQGILRYLERHRS